MSTRSNFVPSTNTDIRSILKELGANSLEEFYWKVVPLRFRSEITPFPGFSERNVVKRLEDIFFRNKKFYHLLGGGFYDHYIPSALPHIVYRSEFYTAYTPYQPEASQGTLQAIYEYQSMICRLTAMEVTNASLYDGGSAIFEAVMMAIRINSRRRILIDNLLNPIYKQMLSTYTANLEIDLVFVDRSEIPEALSDDVSAVVVQMPDFLGQVFDLTDIVEESHRVGALVIQSFYPISLGLLKPPGEMGVDIAVGEGQSLGIGLQFGGPYLGILSTRKQFIRKMPGRIVGRTIDRRGKECFVLTLQAREQHIRREKATSNVCSNESLCALSALVYIALLGERGLRDVARACHLWAKNLLDWAKGLGVEVVSTPPVFNEFAVRIPNLQGLYEACMKDGLVPGLRLEQFEPRYKNILLVSLTENTPEEAVRKWQSQLLTHIQG